MRSQVWCVTDKAGRLVAFAPLPGFCSATPLGAPRQQQHDDQQPHCPPDTDPAPDPSHPPRHFTSSPCPQRLLSAIPSRGLQLERAKPDSTLPSAFPASPTTCAPRGVNSRVTRLLSCPTLPIRISHQPSHPPRWFCAPAATRRPTTSSRSSAQAARSTTSRASSARAAPSASTRTSWSNTTSRCVSLLPPPSAARPAT